VRGLWRDAIRLNHSSEGIVRGRGYRRKYYATTPKPLHSRAYNSLWRVLVDLASRSEE